MRSQSASITVPGVDADTQHRLRQTDIKAGHFERKVQALQNESDNWEKKYEEMEQKHKAIQKELADFHAEIGGL